MSAKDELDAGRPRNSFIRSVGVLVGGTALAHGITALALPVLSRLYSPADFSALAVFTSLLFIISLATCDEFADGCQSGSDVSGSYCRKISGCN